MRGLVAGLPSPHPLGQGLPAVYQDEDAFTMRMTQAFDDLLAPILATLDNLPAYFDPALAPDDFVDWLAEWVAMDIDETWGPALRRSAVAGATDLHGRRGTAAGLADHVRLVTGGEVDLVETGGTVWSVDPGSPLPGSARAALLVRVRVADPGSVDSARLDRLVSAVKPAHVPHTIEITQLDDDGRTGGTPGTPGSARKRPPKPPA